MVKERKYGRPVLYGPRVTLRISDEHMEKLAAAQKELKAHGMPCGLSDALRWIVATWVKP